MAVQAIQMSVKQRAERGSRASKRLRDIGLIPGVIYGHGEDVLPVTLPKREVSIHLHKGAHVFELQVDGKQERVLVKDVQYDHLGSDVIHVDFARVSFDERVKVTVPLELKGEPKGAEEGGVLTQVLASLEIECLVLEIPDAIRHNVAEMALNDVLHISDLKLPAGVKVMQDPGLIVATVKEVLEAAPAEVLEAEGEAEPEVIGRKLAEGEEAAEGAAGAAPAAGEKKPAGGEKKAAEKK
jgi:large subunit ribosomal protein L25